MSFWRTKNNKKITSDSIAVSSDGTTLKDILEYSTEEQRIGTWIDGKPLYRRVFTGKLPTSGSYVILGNVPNLNIVSMYGSANGLSNLKDPIPTYWSNTTKNIPQYNPTTGDLFFTFGSDYNSGTQFNNKQYIIILEYTKTTD